MQALFTEFLSQGKQTAFRAIWTVIFFLPAALVFSWMQIGGWQVLQVGIGAVLFLIIPVAVAAASRAFKPQLSLMEKTMQDVDERVRNLEYLAMIDTQMETFEDKYRACRDLFIAQKATCKAAREAQIQNPVEDDQSEADALMNAMNTFMDFDVFYQNGKATFVPQGFETPKLEVVVPAGSDELDGYLFRMDKMAEDFRGMANKAKMALTKD